MDAQSNESEPLLPELLSYDELRVLIGILGFVFPLVLLLGGLIIFDTGLQNTVSAYYYTGMRDVFVGILFAIAVFLFCYNGYPAKPIDPNNPDGPKEKITDNFYAKIASLSAFGIALFPTPKDGDSIISAHLVFATLFFVMTIIFARFRFTLSDPKKKLSSDEKLRKDRRNRVYKICSYVMIACLLLIGAYFVYEKANSERPLLDAYKPVFFLETIALWAFAFSWLIKAHAVRKEWEEKFRKSRIVTAFAKA